VPSLLSWPVFGTPFSQIVTVLPAGGSGALRVLVLNGTPLMSRRVDSSWAIVVILQCGGIAAAAKNT
jgi:hypothetical protein